MCKLSPRNVTSKNESHKYGYRLSIFAKMAEKVSSIGYISGSSACKPIDLSKERQ